ncbi:hypothetical protein QBC39DRAFT_369799, partial [Podospora conica]
MNKNPPGRPRVMKEAKLRGQPSGQEQGQNVSSSNHVAEPVCHLEPVGSNHQHQTVSREPDVYESIFNEAPASLDIPDFGQFDAGVTGTWSVLEHLQGFTPSLSPASSSMARDVSEWPGSLPRHAAVIEHARNLLYGDPTKMATFQNHISTYNKGSQTSDQLIENFFTLFSASHHALGTLVRELGELFENKEKAEQLRKSWQKHLGASPAVLKKADHRLSTFSTKGATPAEAGSGT